MTAPLRAPSPLRRLTGIGSPVQASRPNALPGILVGPRGTVTIPFAGQVPAAGRTTYEIERDGRVAAVVKKELFSFFHHRFTVDVPGPDDLEAEGSFTDHEYVFRRGDRDVATVSKRWFALGDTYGIEIADGEDDVLILASAVVVDQACHRDDGKRH